MNGSCGDAEQAIPDSQQGMEIQTDGWNTPIEKKKSKI
jgi:hypothetical protein